MEAKKTILIVEDNDINREMLSMILEDKYNVVAVENGLLGIEKLHELGKQISLIMLDIQMPVMNGYEFLDSVREEGVYTDIPIIVTTGGNTDEEQIKSLDKGASDFVVKPYNADVIMKRAEALIRLRETSAVLHKVEKDVVTGAYNKEFFMEYVSQQLERKPYNEYDILCAEVESFDLLYGRYGKATSDAFMREFVESIQKTYPKNSIVGMNSDDVVLVFTENVSFEEHKAFKEKAVATLREEDLPRFPINFAIYRNIDKDLSIEKICHNAKLALEGLRFNPDAMIGEFDEQFRERLELQEEMKDGFERAVADKEFRVYYQPKHDVATGKVGGAEALIRWIHPERGFMSPGAFIPFFETNGYICRVDLFVIETACQDIRRWLDEGRNIVPVSMNISQVDFDQAGLVETITEIVDRNRVPHELVHFEITESFNATDKVKKKNAVEEFKKNGFMIELDDFGSGYSTLNTLGQLPIDIIKVDMDLIRNMFDPKHQVILKGALYTASQLEVEVVAEGVETVEMVEAMKEMRPENTRLLLQGYYYSKPLPVAEFEAYMENN